MNLEQAIGNAHFYLVYIPIVLFFGALVADIIYYFRRDRALIFGHWLVIAGVLMCIPALFSGVVLESIYDQNNPILIEHRLLGFTTGVAGSFYAGLRIAAMWWDLKIPPGFYIALSALLFALISWTADYGALISFITEASR